ncbi:helix-turn-helix domain-containing protein [Kitasatospora sp. NPDC085879]|uniref:TetR/AcrR family transcriptional regulator n=1 Tax=Kitasatospora sp. NPDC085879 TaxID=3154769 RepID=UPI00343C7A22
MARVSQAHLDARRRQILDGAARCFARNGFHATSMQDVLRESDLSAGAVYRYFASKDEIVAAIAGEAFAVIGSAFADAAAAVPPPTPDVLLGRVLTAVFERASPAGDRQALACLIIQVWTETLRNPTLAATLDEGWRAMRAAWAGLVESYRATGLMPPGPDADHVARTLIATAQGFIAQQALFGDADPSVVQDGLRALTGMRTGAAQETP